jgi:hypothetical protein
VVGDRLGRDLYRAVFYWDFARLSIREAPLAIYLLDYLVSADVLVVADVCGRGGAAALPVQAEVKKGQLGQPGPGVDMSQTEPTPKSTDKLWPPLIYHAHVPLYIKVRDVLITLAGWLLIVDLLEDIWVLVTQWLHLTVFKRKVEVDHLLFTLWGNIHEFFYVSMAFVAVVVLAGLSRRHVLRRPVDGNRPTTKHTTEPSLAQPAPSPSRLMRASVDANGKIKLRDSG